MVDILCERYKYIKIIVILGGLVIFISFLVGMILVLIDKLGFLLIYFGVLIIIVIGFIDDIFDLLLKWKMLG